MQLNYTTNAHYGQFKTIQINKHPGWDGSSRPHYAWHRGWHSKFQFLKFCLQTHRIYMPSFI